MYLECHVHVSLHIPLILQDVLEAGRHVRHDLRQVLQTKALGHPDILRLLEKIYNFERYNMRINLDIIWNKNKETKYINLLENFQPLYLCLFCHFFLIRKYNLSYESSRIKAPAYLLRHHRGCEQLPVADAGEVEIQDDGVVDSQAHQHSDQVVFPAEKKDKKKIN